MPAMPVHTAITNRPLPLSPPPAIELDLSDANVDATKPGDIRARFQRALESQEATKNIKCCGLTRNANDAAKVRLLFRFKDDEETVRSHSGRLDTAFRGARMRSRQWYPVKVDSANKKAVFNEERTALRADACKVMSEENGVEIVHERWLSKPSDRLYGSAVIYLAKKSDADALLAGRVMDTGGEAAYTDVFEHRPRPRRCFRCQSYDRQKFRCGDEERCVRRRRRTRGRQLRSSVEKYATCSGPHSADFERDD
ncbi:hypothetical protein MPH_13509 [Macrophomina phaseolina MS6]|uniref:Uncharacterized protein n=1 Tax=Macrophomina phaseolina (strain MS6) TaxID=1126212 RepID=K2R5K6_MACPH|nr:hypothetical protein MPH_13509 [Macrophomina phaseolina MS6]